VRVSTSVEGRTRLRACGRMPSPTCFGRRWRNESTARERLTPSLRSVARRTVRRSGSFACSSIHATSSAPSPYSPLTPMMTSFGRNSPSVEGAAPRRDGPQPKGGESRAVDEVPPPWADGGGVAASTIGKRSSTGGASGGGIGAPAGVLPAVATAAEAAAAAVRRWAGERRGSMSSMASKPSSHV
jgi:hypothetical protein